MILPVIYIALYVLTIALFFINSNWPAKTRKILIQIHLASLTILIIELLLVKTFRGVWFDRMLVITFSTTASAVFVIYRKNLPLLQKVYFGLFFFYPLIAAISFLFDRIMFAIVASPLILSLTLPEIKYSDQVYEVRTNVGIMSPVHLSLIRKGLLTEEVVGTCQDEDVAYRPISSLKIINETKDSINSVFISRDETFKVAFTK